MGLKLQLSIVLTLSPSDGNLDTTVTLSNSYLVPLWNVTDFLAIGRVDGRESFSADGIHKLIVDEELRDDIWRMKVETAKADLSATYS